MTTIENTRAERSRSDTLVDRSVARIAGWSPGAFVAALGVTVAIFRLPVVFARALSIDEFYYAVGARRLLAGGLFYRDVVDHKAPGIYWIYAALFRWWGGSHLAVVHVASVIAVASTAMLIAAVGERLIDRRSGRAAGMIYAVVSGIGPPGDVLAANCELFMNLPAVAAMAVYLSRSADADSASAAGPAPSVVRLMVVGSLAAVAALVKVQGAAIMLPIVAHLVWTRGRRLPLRLLALNLAFLLPIGILVAGYAASESLDDLGWAIRYGASTFIQAVDLQQKLVNGLRNSALLALMYAPLLTAAMLFVGKDRAADSEARRRLVVLGAWLMGAFVAVCAGGRFYPHYYLQILPPLALLAGGFVARGKESMP